MVTCCRFAFFVSYREDDPSVWISTMHFNSRGKLKITIHFRNGPHRRMLLCWLLTDLMGVWPLRKRRRWNSYSPGHMNDCCIVLIAVALYTCGEERRSAHNYTLRIKRANARGVPRPNRYGICVERLYLRCGYESSFQQRQSL